MKKYYRLNNDQKIAGVCSGLGEYFKTDPVFFRVFFIILAFASGLGIFAYVVMWLISPVKELKNSKTISKQIYISDKDKKVAGVCGGLGEYFDIDPIFFRLGFVLLILFAGIGLLAYLVLWIIIPKKYSLKTTTKRSSKMTRGEDEQTDEQKKIADGAGEGTTEESGD